MKLDAILKKIVYESKFYLIITVFQLLVIIGLLSFILYDFNLNIRLSLVKNIELILAILMIVDLIFFTILDKKLNFFIFTEWLIVFIYLIIIFLVEFKEIGNENEILEIYLVCFRMFFQIFRLTMTFYVFNRLTQSSNVRKDMELKISQELGDSNFKSSKVEGTIIDNIDF